MNNFFITGDKAVGKTTILKNILLKLDRNVSVKLNMRIAGFVTARISDSKSGRPLLFALRPAEELRNTLEKNNLDTDFNLIKNIDPENTSKENPDNNVSELINFLRKNIKVSSELEAYFDKERVFAFRKDPSQKFTVREEVFNNYGVSLLEKEADLIIMDELGRFELNAENFQKKVFNLLDSEKTILGIIKAESNSFLDKIRERNDIKIFWVTKDNRDKVYRKVYKLVKKAVQKREK